ncbi:MAG: hypothetical protein N2111_01465 [Candidatus Sumerlaeaceae bacterium]|nr:hypothetical protein [Candidatus Sumerlaeaceae bacterium]
MASGPSLRSAAAGLAAESNDLMEVEYQQVGANEEEAVRLACIRAVRAGIGRLLFSDYSLQARDLLEPYIQREWQKFVASFYVLERRKDRDGFGVRIRVNLLPEVLMRDLKEKRFLYKPRPMPYHLVFSSEIFEGTPVTASTSRDAIMTALEGQGARVLRTAIPGGIPPNLPVLADANNLNSAREAAARAGAELIVAALVATRKVDEKEVFYDKMNTYETAVKLAFLRADDGVVAAETEVVQRSSDPDDAVARKGSIEQAVQRAVEQLYEQVSANWQVTERDQAKYEIMFTHLTQNEVPVVQRHLETTLAKGTKARLRSFYGDVAVVALDTPRDYAAVQRAVLDFRSFDMRITDRVGRRITVDVKH